MAEIGYALCKVTLSCNTPETSLGMAPKDLWSNHFLNKLDEEPMETELNEFELKMRREINAFMG